MAIERANSNACRARDRFQARFGSLRGENRLGRIQQPRAVTGRIGTRPPAGFSTGNFFDRRHTTPLDKRRIPPY